MHRYLQFDDCLHESRAVRFSVKLNLEGGILVQSRHANTLIRAGGQYEK